MSYGRATNQLMYSDQKNWSDTYLTDPALIKALGPFAVDPCCPPGMPWTTARRMLVDGVVDGAADTTSWGGGRAWMNPPYRRVVRWAERFVQHGSGVCLLNGRSPETRATQVILAECSGVFLPAGRLTFYKVTGEPYVGKWFPSVLIGMSATDAAKLAGLPRRGFPGVFLRGPNGG